MEKTKTLSPRARAAVDAELPALEAALERLLPSFDTEVNACTCCKLNVARSYGDVQAFELIQSTLKKLRKI